MKVEDIEFWNIHSQLAIFTFSMIPSKGIFGNDSVIYIEFPRAFPPRLNRFGYVTCTLNESQCACDFIEDRRIKIWINTTSQFFKASEKITIKIYGVTVPKDTSEISSNPGFLLTDFRKV